MRRELAGYFGRPLAYFALVLFLGLLAVLSLWFEDVLLRGVASMRTPFFWTATCFLFLIPALTMRTIAEERRTGSLEMITTLPITPGELVVGKWLAAVTVVAAALGLTASYPIAMSILGDLDGGPVRGGYLGLLLLGGAFAAIGIAASSATTNQVSAFLGALTVCVTPWLAGFLLPIVPGDWVPIVQYFTFEYHFSNLARGVIDTRSIVFFAATITVALHLAVSLLEHRRLS